MTIFTQKEEGKRRISKVFRAGKGSKSFPFGLIFRAKGKKVQKHDK
jgi:hypothetical protein